MLGLAAMGEEISVLIWPSLMEFQIDLNQQPSSSVRCRRVISRALLRQAGRAMSA